LATYTTDPPIPDLMKIYIVTTDPPIPDLIKIYIISESCERELSIVRSFYAFCSKNT
jgi:hypothetical protein